MDLKGSLVDTNLRIYPSEKLIQFLKTLPPSDQIPHNIKQIIESNSISKFQSYKLQDLKAVHLNCAEIEYLKNVRNNFDEICKNEAIGDGEYKIVNDIKESKEDSAIEKSTEEKLEIKKVTDNNKLDKNDTTKCENNEKNENQKSAKECLNINENESPYTGPFLVTSDIDWLYIHIKTRRSNGEKNISYLHTLLEGALIEMPENETIKRNPVLEARCVKLRAQQDAREYRKMTKGVDNVRMRFPEDSISYQMKQLNRHLIVIGQFILSIFAGFLFGFKGVEWMLGNLDFGFRLLLGVMCALVIALAEIYFIAKKLNEELCIPETVQLGGPVKFADQDSYNYKNNESGSKPHQD